MIQEVLHKIWVKISENFEYSLVEGGRHMGRREWFEPPIYSSHFEPLNIQPRAMLVSLESTCSTSTGKLGKLGTQRPYGSQIVQRASFFNGGTSPVSSEDAE